MLDWLLDDREKLMNRILQALHPSERSKRKRNETDHLKVKNKEKGEKQYDMPFR